MRNYLKRVGHKLTDKLEEKTWRIALIVIVGVLVVALFTYIFYLLTGVDVW